MVEARQNCTARSCDFTETQLHNNDVSKSPCWTNCLLLGCALLPVVVVLAFIICWLPYHIGRNLFAQVDNYRMAKLSQNFNMASMVLTYLSASINPVVYNLMSRKYRAAAKRLFLLHHRPSQAHGSQRQFSVMEPISTLNESLTGVWGPLGLLRVRRGLFGLARLERCVGEECLVPFCVWVWKQGYCKTALKCKARVSRRRSVDEMTICKVKMLIQKGTERE